MLPSKSASHKMLIESRKHGECYQYDQTQIDLINTGMANIEDCEPFKVDSIVTITEFNDGEFEGVTYTDPTWVSR